MSRPAVAGGLVVAVTVAAVLSGAATATARSASPTLGRAPLTGRLDPTGATRAHGALAVKIENTPEARPQAGLDEADVVYEEVVEGGITRFWAVFDSRIPSTVGPIRSVRALDPDLVAPLHAVVAYSGGTDPNVVGIRAATNTWVDETNAVRATPAAVHVPGRGVGPRRDSRPGGHARLRPALRRHLHLRAGDPHVGTQLPRRTASRRVGTGRGTHERDRPVR